VGAGAPFRSGAGHGWSGRVGRAGLIALVGVGLVVVALAATRDQPVVWPERVGSPAVGPAAAAVGPRIQTVLANTHTYYGRDVTLDGRVGRVVAPRAFTLREGDEEILVLAQYPLPPAPGRSADRPLAAGDPVGVTGTVRTFNLAFFQRDLGYDLDPALFGDWADRTAMFALWIDRSP